MGGWGQLGEGKALSVLHAKGQEWQPRPPTASHTEKNTEHLKGKLHRPLPHLPVDGVPRKTRA